MAGQRRTGRMSDVYDPDCSAGPLLGVRRLRLRSQPARGQDWNGQPRNKEGDDQA